MKPLTILHTEASPGWGGQEIRSLKEAVGMTRRGHRVLFAIQKGGGLVQPARDAGFNVYEIPFKKLSLFKACWILFCVMKREKVDVVNTHSSLDAWLGGVIARLTKKKVIRTRHLSTPVRRGLNSYLLYNRLADVVVTTCEKTAIILRKQAKLKSSECLSIPTGIELNKINPHPILVADFRRNLGWKEEDCVVGTCCVLRGWKGISDLLYAAKTLEHIPHLKWLVIGGGVSEDYFRQQQKNLGLEDKVIFTGHLNSPYVAIGALDIFVLLSWANEGVSQASLQAAALKKPLVTTAVGGLKEVCIDGKTGFIVGIKRPFEVARAVEKLMKDPSLRQEMGERAYFLVKKYFTQTETLNRMEQIYERINQ
ncbi:MAG: glycosyltransferase family 4 protein [Chlamydiia bacterium]|nr:glycosyltransferase family 4 protein [Chlamydiia bacterium]